MNKTVIEWCDMTWNPVVGCQNNCPYCYARKMHNRFKKNVDSFNNPELYFSRLNKPQTVKKPKNVFVCSMADLFGRWVPDEWIQEVFKACEAAPQHRYLFLTKNFHAYKDFGIILKKNYWYGQSHDGNNCVVPYDMKNQFISLEPMQRGINPKAIEGFQWVIIGAETGNRKGKIIPKREWIENIVNACRDSKVPVFLKNNLASVWEEPLIQEFPWKENSNGKDSN